MEAIPFFYYLNLAKNLAFNLYSADFENAVNQLWPTRPKGDLVS